MTMIKEEETDDFEFIQILEQQARNQRNLFPRDVVVRIHQLAAKASGQELNRTHYRLPQQYLMALIREARSYLEIRQKVENLGCRVLKQRSGLTLLITV